MSVGMKDFEIMRYIGKGAYGAVYLVRKKNNNDRYAMKIIDFSQQVIDIIL